MRVDESVLQNDRLKVFVDVCDDARLILVHFLEFQVFWKVNNLGSFKTHAAVEIGVHLLRINSNEQVWVIDVPKNVVSSSLEIGNEDGRIIYWVVEESISSVINADASCS